jgi:hypothetical protein
VGLWGGGSKTPSEPEFWAAEFKGLFACGPSVKPRSTVEANWKQNGRSFRALAFGSVLKEFGHTTTTTSTAKMSNEKLGKIPLNAKNNSMPVAAPEQVGEPWEFTRSPDGEVYVTLYLTRGAYGYETLNTVDPTLYSLASLERARKK